MAIWNRGIDFKNSSNTTTIGGIGLYGSDNTPDRLYLGFGSEPWKNPELQVTKTSLSFKGNKVYHAGDKPSASDIGAALESHNHTSLSSVTTIGGAGASSSWGSLDITGSKGGWQGIHFKDFGYIWMVRNDGYTGMWKNASTPIFTFNQNGALTDGTVPWTRLTGIPTTFAPSSPHANSVSGTNATGTTPAYNANLIWKSGFYESESGNGVNYPSTNSWYWLLHAGHTSNRSDYRYGMQIAGQNSSSNFFIRTVNANGDGTWRTLWHSGNFDPNTKSDTSHNHDTLVTRNTIGVGFDKTKTGFQRPNGNGLSNGELVMHIAHPDFTGGQYSRGLAFKYGDNLGMYTYALSPDGNKITQARVYTEADRPSAADVGAMADGGTYGTLVLNNWFRSVGNTGWYNNTYQGGWYMEDSTWIRAYNSKNVYTPGTFRCDSEMQARILRVQGAPGEPAFGHGGGDSASWGAQNIRLNCHWGFGIQAYDNKARIVMNARNGDIAATGNVYTQDGHGEGRVGGFEPNRGTGRTRIAQGDNVGNLRIELVNNNSNVGEFLLHYGYFYPYQYTCIGHPDRRWGQIYSTSGSISTSDSKLKENIKAINRSEIRTLDNDDQPTSYDFYDYIKNTGVYTFNYKREFSNDPQTWLGVLADEIPDNIFDKIGMMSKSQEEYEKELLKHKELENILANTPMTCSDEELRDFENTIVAGTELTYKELKNTVERGVNEPVRMLNSSSQIAMLQEVLSIALNKIEYLENELSNLKQSYES